MSSDDFSTHVIGYNGNLSRENKTAEITLFKGAQSFLHGTFSFYKINKLKSLPIFQKAEAGEVETLVNGWYTKTAPGVVIKFATEKNLAFVFTSEDATEEQFKLFIPVARSLCNDDDFKGKANSYFDEVSFVHFLASHQLTVDMLRHDHHFSESRISLLVAHQYNFRALLKHGVCLQQIKEMRSVLLAESDLPDVLRLVTLDQISGKNHIAPSAPKMVFQLPEWEPNRTKGTARSESGPFDMEFANNACEISYHHKKNGTLAIMSLRAVAPEAKHKLDAGIKGLIPERLIHDWYHLPECRSEFSGFITRKIYCPSLNLAIIKKIAPSFPEQKYDDAIDIPCGINPAYYREQQFANFLIKKGCPLESLRQLPGMTYIKLMTLYAHQDLLIALLKRGMALTDFAKIDENRLLHVFAYEYSAIRALRFVKPAELLGMEQRTLHCSSRMFSSHVISEMDESDSEEECSYAASSVPV